MRRWLLWRKRLFYGWRMVGVAFGAHLIASGLGFYALPRLLQPLADEFANGARAEVAGLTAAMSLAGIFVGPMMGQWIARFGLRRVMPIGAAVMAAGFLAVTQASALWHFYLVYAIAVPIGVSALSAVGGNALVANWFDQRRSMALGIAQIGLSLAGVAGVYFISWTLARGGWETTYLAFAVIALVAAPLLFLVVRDRPADLGLQPDGADAPADAAPPSAGDWTFGDAMRDPNLWYAGVAAGLCFFGSTGVLQNVHALATDAGHSPDQANSVLALFSIGAALGKLVFGALGVRFGERTSFAVAILAQGACMALLPFSKASLIGLSVMALGFGLALGGIMPALSGLLARLYGTARFAPAMGYMSPIMIPFQLSGPFVFALVSDRTGSYDPALFGAAGTSLIALLLVLRIGRNGAGAPPPQPAESATQRS